MKRAYHAGKHATQAPHIQGIVVVLVVDEQLGTLEVARSHAHIVSSTRMVEVGQTPVD